MFTVDDMMAGGGTLLLEENTSRFTAPLLLVHGSGDVVTSHLASKRFIDAIPSKDKTYEEYDGAYHEIHNDLGRDKVIQDCIQWILARSQKTAKL